jgi:hypothetical protein
LWGVLDGLVSGVLNRVRLSDLVGGETGVSLSLRRHLEETIDQLLGDQVEETKENRPQNAETFEV